MPESEVEYAVRSEHGEIIPHPTLAFALRSAKGIRGHGGTAVLVSRTVVRSDWAEVEDTEPCSTCGQLVLFGHLTEHVTEQHTAPESSRLLRPSERRAAEAGQ